MIETDFSYFFPTSNETQVFEEVKKPKRMQFSRTEARRRIRSGNTIEVIINKVEENCVQPM